MTEEEFLLRRRMFCFWQGTLYLASEPQGRTHHDWLTSCCGLEKATEMGNYALRGYTLDKQIVFYTGPFQPQVDHEDVATVLDILNTDGRYAEIGFGVQDCRVFPWKPKTDYNLFHYLVRAARHRANRVSVTEER